MADNIGEIGDSDFHQVDSGASQVYPIQCSALRKGGHVLIKGKPCKIVEMTTSKTGKHGSAKVHLTGIDIFTNKKYEDISPSTANMEVPNVIRREYELMNISDENFLELIDETGGQKDDVRVPDDDIGKEIKKRFDDGETLLIQVLSAMGTEAAVQVRQASEKAK